MNVLLEYYNAPTILLECIDSFQSPFRTYSRLILCSIYAKYYCTSTSVIHTLATQKFSDIAKAAGMHRNITSLLF